MRLATPVYRQFLEWGILSLCTRRCIRSGTKPRVVLDGEILLGKLHFSLWRPCHKSFPRKSFTTSTSRSAKRPFSMVSSCAATPRKNFAETSKCPLLCLQNGTKKRNASRSFAIFSLAWWNIAGTYWRSSILWLVRTCTTIACSEHRTKSALALPYLIFRDRPNVTRLSPKKNCPKVQVKNCQATLRFFRES